MASKGEPARVGDDGIQADLDAALLSDGDRVHSEAASDVDNIAVALRDPDDPDELDENACCCIKWKYVFIYAVWNFVNAIPPLLTRPILVDVQKNYFGSDQRAALVQSAILSVIAFINLFLVVAYGRLLDSLGRKPFFVASSAASVVVYASLAAFEEYPIVFMALQGLSNLIQSSYGGAYIADMVPPQHRAKAFTITSAIAAIAMFSSLPVGVIKAPNMVFYVVALAFAVINLAFAIVVLPESLPKRNRKKFDSKGAFGNPLAGAKILLKSKAMMMIACVACILVTADVGTQDIFMFYLNQRVGFTQQDNAFFFVENAVMALIGYLIILPLLLRFVSHVTVLCLGIASNATLLILTATVWARWCVFAFIGPVYGLLIIINPVANAMITNIGHERDVGKRITAMTAMSDFCSAAGPLIFGSLYGTLPPALIALPFFIFGGLCYLTVGFMWFKLGPAIREDQEQVQKELAEEAAANGEEAPDENDVHSPVAVGRGLYNEEDCE